MPYVHVTAHLRHYRGKPRWIREHYRRWPRPAFLRRYGLILAHRHF
jgi:hypothetical protein